MPAKVTAKKTTKPPLAGSKGAQASPTTPFQQDPFDPRIRILSSPFAPGTTTPIQRGHMAWDPNIRWPAPYGSAKQTWAGAPKILFLFNPSTIAASYQISDATAQSALIYPATSGVQPILRVPLQQQVSFTIMFDRTYELNDPGSRSEMIQFGVELDILAVKQFTGMFATVFNDSNGNNDPLATLTGATQKASTTSINAPGTGGGIQQGVQQMTFSYVYFGAPGQALQYYGYIDSWDVQYTHFAQDMVPMRAVVDISFTLLPPPSARAPDPGAATTAAQQATNPTTGLPNSGPSPTTIHFTG